MYRFVRPLLFSLPPEIAHALTLQSLNCAYRLHVLRSTDIDSDPVDLLGLKFPNRIGLAAGLDKSGTCIDALGALGFGFIEIGTITPRPQPGNARPRLFRLVEDGALINRMGFPNDGVARISERLRRRSYKGVCGVNIGKNAITPLTDAAADYIACLAAIYSVADYAAINISSPNTAELRRLQQGELLKSLLENVMEARAALMLEHGRCVPLLLKLTADLDDSALEDAGRISMACGIDGIIVSNTTLRRDALLSANRDQEGGLSGVPLFPRALHAVACLRATVGSKLPIVGVGGIENGQQARTIRSAGADLVQIYTGLIYRGPRLIRELLTVN